MPATRNDVDIAPIAPARLPSSPLERLHTLKELEAAEELADVEAITGEAEQATDSEDALAAGPAVAADDPARAAVATVSLIGRDHAGELADVEVDAAAAQHCREQLGQRIVVEQVERQKSARRLTHQASPASADIAESNLYTDALGRIKVQFPWDRYGPNTQNSSCWVRVSSEWAGNQLGGMHLPRVGQEVIVSFIGGDIDRPICTGRVYNQANLPPWQLPAQQALSGLRSRELTPGGGNSAAAAPTTWCWTTRTRPSRRSSRATTSTAA